MYVSLNELQNTSSKALEARCLGNSTCTSLATNIVKLEALGLQGVDRLLAALAQPHTPAPWQRQRQGLSFAHNPDIVQSVALGYYLAEQLHDSAQSYSVSNAASIARWLLPTLSGQWRRVAHYCQLEWSEANISYRAQVDSHGLAWATKPETYPSSGLRLTAIEVTSDWEANLGAQGWQVRNRQLCAGTYQRSLQQGLYISTEHWQRLQQHAAAVLVPDSLSSGQDAGADATSVDPECLRYSPLSRPK